MATTHQDDHDRINRMIVDQFPAKDRQAVHDLVWPLIKDDGYLVKHILSISGGRREAVELYVEMARVDYRDVLTVGMMPIDTVEAIDDLHEMCDYFGADRDPELVALREQLLRKRDSPPQRPSQRPWWKFW